MLKLAAEERPPPTASGFYERYAQPAGVSHRVDGMLIGHPDLAAGLASARMLLDAKAVWLHRVTSTGSPGEMIAGVDEETPPRGAPAWLAIASREGAVDAGRWLFPRSEALDTYVVPLHTSTGERFMLSVRIDAPRRDDRHRDEGHIRALLPMIALAVTQWVRAEREQRACEQQCALLENCGFGLVAIDEHGAIHSATPAARCRLAEPPLSDRDGRLGIANMEDAVRFQLAVRRILDADEDASPEMLSIRRNKEFPLLMTIRPLPLQAPRPRLALVQIIDPLEQSLLPIEPLSTHFGLTGVERRLVEQLAIGRTIAEAASALRLKEQTARSYLKQVFQKTGICRQVELVGLLLKGAVPLS